MPVDGCRRLLVRIQTTREVETQKRTRATAVVGVLAGVLSVGLAGSASASSVPVWRLEVCSCGTYQTNVYWGNGGFMGVPPGQCGTRWFQRREVTFGRVEADVVEAGQPSDLGLEPVYQWSGLAGSGRAGVSGGTHRPGVAGGACEDRLP